MEEGIQTSYLETLAVINSTKNQIVDLGPVARRLIVYPCIDSILEGRANKL